MAVRYWDGDTDTNWQTAANWSANTKPLADDEVIFDGRQIVGPTEGMLDSESGAAAECTFDLLHVKSTFTGDIGSAAEPCCCSPDTLIIEGPGTFYFLCGKDDQSTDTTIPNTIINNPSATVYLYSNANDGANTCEFTNVTVVGGTVYIAYYSVDTDDQGCYVANMYIAPRNNSSSDTDIIIEKDAYKVNGVVPPNYEMQNGTLRSDTMMGTTSLFGGTINYGSEPITSISVVEADMNITALRVYGGTFNWYPNDTGDPTITLLYMAGGVFDASAAAAIYSPDIAKTITEAWLNRGATMKIDNNRGNITVSKLWNMGGTLSVDSGSQITIGYDLP